MRIIYWLSLIGDKEIRAVKFNLMIAVIFIHNHYLLFYLYMYLEHFLTYIHI